MLQSENINEISAALAKAQCVMKSAPYNKINPHFKSQYADLSAVIGSSRVLAENGIAVVQSTTMSDGPFRLVTRLCHSSGQWMAAEYPLPATATPQQLGAALTYARRYTLSAMVGIAADEDDDANAVDNIKVTTEKKRDNPHKTVPSDIVPDIEYNQYGEPVDNIPLGDPSIEQLSRAKANPSFKTWQENLYKLNNIPALNKFGEASANLIATFPADFQAIARGLFKEHKDSLKEKEAA